MKKKPVAKRARGAGRAGFPLRVEPELAEWCSERAASLGLRSRNELVEQSLRAVRGFAEFVERSAAKGLWSHEPADIVGILETQLLDEFARAGLLDGDAMSAFQTAEEEERIRRLEEERVKRLFEGRDE